MPKRGITCEVINGMRPHRSQHSRQSVGVPEIASPKPDRFQILEPTQVAIWSMQHMHFVSCGDKSPCEV
jgi:hypothetical protein